MESHVVSTLTWKTNFQVHQWLSLTRKPHPGGHTGLGASLQGIRNAARTLFLLHGCLWIFRVAKAMTPHSSALAWKIPWTEEPGGLQSMGWQRVRHDWATSLSLFTFMHWRRKWQPTPVFLLGESQGRGSLVGCCLRVCIESDTREET